MARRRPTDGHAACIGYHTMPAAHRSSRTRLQALDLLVTYLLLNWLPLLWVTVWSVVTVLLSLSKPRTLAVSL